MNDVNFQEPTFESPASAQIKKQSLLTRLVIKLGLAKDERGAQYVMVVIAILAIIASIFFFNKSLPHHLTPAEAAKLPVLP